MRIAFLGLGQMGTAVVKRLRAAGHEVVVWNRTAAAAERLEGVRVATSAAEAASSADVLLSMLMNDDAVTSVILGDGGNGGILEHLPAGAVHVCLSTISVALSKRLSERHQAHGQAFLAAPVFGRPNIAAEGKLWIVAAGDARALEPVRPLLQSFSRGLTVLPGEASNAHAFKIGGNFLITAMIESLSESMVFAETHGIDPALFLETVNSALFQSPFYAAYGKVMLEPPPTPGATITLGAKDMRLFRDAARQAGMRTPLGDHFAADLERASEAGLAQADWAAGLYQLAKNTDTAEIR